MIKTLFVAGLMSSAAHLATVAPASAASMSVRAPAGCFTCQSLCSACEKAGKQVASGRCAPSCAAWAQRAGVKQIFVRKDLSVCGSSPNAYGPARC